MKNCTKRKSEYRIHELLPNGQHFNLYFVRHKTKERMRVWTVGLCISETRKRANLWFNRRSKKYDLDITGKCGLTGLKRALDYILLFTNSLGKYEEIQIGWVDERRKRVYKRLERYGFVEDKKLECYVGWNSRYWN